MSIASPGRRSFQFKSADNIDERGLTNPVSTYLHETSTNYEFLEIIEARRPCRQRPEIDPAKNRLSRSVNLARGNSLDY